MTVIQFDNGIEVEFDGVPTQADVDEVYRQISSQGQTSQPQSQPRSTEELDALSAEQNMAMFPARTGEGPLAAGAKAIGNLPSSAINFSKGIFDIVTNPIDTAKGLGSVALGGVQKLIPGEQKSEQAFEGAVGYLKDRYGGTEQLQRTATNDPLGIGLDILTGITGGAGLASKASKIAGASKAANVLDKVSDTKKFVDSTRINAVTEGITNWLQKSSMNLSSAQTQKFQSGMKGVSDWLTKNKVVGPSAVREKIVSRALDKMEDTFQSAISKSGVLANRDEIINSLESLKSTPDFVDDISRFDNVSDIDKAIAVFRAYPDQIPLDTVNRIKRSAFKKAYNKQGQQVLSDVDFAIADKIYDEMAKVADAGGLKINGKLVKDFNADYKNAITARKIMQISALKNPTLISRAISILLGYGIGQGWGALGGAAFSGVGGNVVSGALNTLKSGTAAVGGLGAPKALPSVLQGTRQASGVDEYLKSIGL